MLRNVTNDLVLGQIFWHNLRNGEGLIWNSESSESLELGGKFIKTSSKTTKTRLERCTLWSTLKSQGNNGIEGHCSNNVIPGILLQLCAPTMISICIVESVFQQWPRFTIVVTICSNNYLKSWKLHSSSEKFDRQTDMGWSTKCSSLTLERGEHLKLLKIIQGVHKLFTPL
jgi:hypothetical protein